ncbi:sesquiterpene cyclase [Myxococcus sp. AM011]|uniref:terpene synthase family protein n=1 Tax=Myxococcus sp. AM011 TaxID=2745200 RepID=UPI00159580D4|nr:sesquiterpene cyclase [Myxococcus sp. AM011]NVJ26240.1 sesquiterpene cyclase [Myxococcus sp. AM011]
MLENLTAQLEHIRIPTFTFPWAGACSPYVESVEHEAMQWALRQGLIPTEQYLARLTRAKYGGLVARCYPHADRELIQIIADMNYWYFISDDLFVDRVETITRDTLPNLTAILDVLDLNRPGEKPVFGEAAFLDICQRLRRRLSPEHFDRFAQGIRMWASIAGLQMVCQLLEEPLAMRPYEAIRRYTGGMIPSLALSDAANAGKVPPDEYHRPDVLSLMLHTTNAVCWANDIQSVALEVRQPGQFRNMVILHAAQGHTIQEGIDYTARKVYEEIDAFQREASQVEPHASKELRGFITGMRDWMRGYQDWVDLDTQRYSQQFLEQDANDSGVLRASR